MQFIYFAGRILLVVIFLGTGARQLLNRPAAAQFIESWMPPLFAPYAEKLSTLLGMSTPGSIAIVLAVVQIALALFVIFNVGSRFAAILLALYLACSTGYVFASTNFTDPLLNEQRHSTVEEHLHYRWTLDIVRARILVASRGRRGLLNPVTSAAFGRDSLASVHAASGKPFFLSTLVMHRMRSPTRSSLSTSSSGNSMPRASSTKITNSRRPSQSRPRSCMKCVCSPTRERLIPNWSAINTQIFSLATPFR
jgi:uncharacterized membrane protein YphA (DoxX/SURF4 family)